LHNTQL